ncbi:MAG: PLP-dependent transferase [Desulfobulbaceae bacterium]|nr:PLP-dependent transferase [Desulfobulbaceae bacterium]HIJ77763.1 O-acetylhomoserine aminocarboxypropyltransferase/cysteine synthase [Deltaproteobacteria bacterium]
MKGFTTKAIHGGLAGGDPYGTLRMPVYDNVAFAHESARAIQLTFEGKKPAHAYSRISNPTVQDLELKIKLLSGSLGVLGVASGMAAISNTILALAEAGTNIVTTRHLFGNSLSLFEKTFGPWGLEVRHVDMDDAASIEGAIDANTRALFLESITNPQLEVADCAMVSAITQRHKIPLIMDNTMMTPYLFNSKKAGVDIEVLSSTKYISGGATSLGGMIIDNGSFDWRNSPRLKESAKKIGPMAFLASLRQEVFRNVGACMSPHNAYLQSLGLESMALRIDKSCDNSMKLAGYLQNHPQVTRVGYPGLADSKFHGIAKKQFKNRFGGLLTFELASPEACFRFIDAMTLIKRATNVNDNKTLIIHPFSTIFAEYSAADKEAMGVPPTMIRLSVGIEDHDDLIDDLDRGFSAL